MKRLLLAGLFALAGGLGNAQASVITFEDLPLDPPMTFGGDRTSGGFLFDTALNHSHIDNGTNWGANNGTTIMVIDDFGAPNPVTMSAGGATFAITGIDLSRANTFSTTSSTQVHVTGNLLGGGTVSTTFQLTPDFKFNTFVFDSSWTNLVSVVLDGDGATCCGQPGNYFAVDNIVVDTAVAPEPTALSLLGLASTVVWSRRRRNDQ